LGCARHWRAFFSALLQLAVRKIVTTLEAGAGLAIMKLTLPDSLCRPGTTYNETFKGAVL